MGLGPCPALGFNLASDLAQLLDGEHVKQARVLEKPAPVLAEQVADDGAASLDIGVSADKHRAPIISRYVACGHVAPDDPRFAVVMQVCEYLLLQGMVLGDGEGHKLIQRKPVLPIDQIGKASFRERVWKYG